MAARPPQLVLAQRWLEAAGDTVEAAEGRGPEGDPIWTLVVTHGAIKLRVVPREDQLAVTVGFGVPAEARAKLRTLPDEVRKKLFVLFRQELLSCHRVGFLYQPTDAADISGIENFVVISLLVIGAKDLSTRNRLLDAIQEVTTTGLRAYQILGIASSGGSTAPPPATAPPPRESTADYSPKPPHLCPLDVAEGGRTPHRRF